MGNPNSVKGTASKLEALMNYQKQRKPKEKSEDQEEEENKLHETTENDQEISQELDQPTMKDFIDIIEDSNILQDKDLSLQLWFLLNYFIKTKMNRNNE